MFVTITFVTYSGLDSVLGASPQNRWHDVWN